MVQKNFKLENIFFINIVTFLKKKKRFQKKKIAWTCLYMSYSV